MKRFTLFLLMIAGLLSGRASETWNQFLTVETDTAEYVAPKDTTVYLHLTQVGHLATGPEGPASAMSTSAVQPGPNTGAGWESEHLI